METSVSTAAGLDLNYWIEVLDSDKRDLERILNYYNVTSKECQAMIHHVAEWFKMQSCLPKNGLENQVILRHLITTSFSVERVKQKINNYFLAKQKIPEILTNRDPLSVRISHCLKEGYWIVLPRRTPENHRVTIFRLKSPTNFLVVADLIKVAFMIGDYRLRNDAVVGDHWVFDFMNITFHQALQMNPRLIAHTSFYLNSCLCPRLKGLHIVNLPSYAEKVLFLFKKTMKSKLLQRIHIYNSFDSIMKVFPKSIVPCNFGGEEISSDEITDKWLKTLQSPAWRQWFIDQDTAVIDELRATKRNAADDTYYGLNGSFRKLDID